MLYHSQPLRFPLSLVITTHPMCLSQSIVGSQVSDSVRLYAARTHRHTHPLNTAVSQSPPPSPPSLPEPQFSHSHTDVATTTTHNAHIDTTTSIIVHDSSSCLILDTSTTDPDPSSSLVLYLTTGPGPRAIETMVQAIESINHGNTADMDQSSSLCMTSVGTLDRAMLQLDDDDDDNDEADEPDDDEQEAGCAGGGDDNNDDDVDTDRLLVDDTANADDPGGLLLFPSSLDHSTTIDTSVATLDRAMLQLTTTCTTVDIDIDIDNSELSAALPSSLLIASFEQPSSSSSPSSSPLPLPLPSPNTTSNDTDNHIPCANNSDNLHLRNNTATSDHSSGSANSSSGLFSYDSVSCHHEELRQLPSINVLNMGDNGATEDNLTPDLRRCAADPVAKTLLQLSGKLSDKINDDDHQGFPVGNGDSRGGDGVGGALDNCLRGGHDDDNGYGNGKDGSGDDGDDMGGDMDCCGDEEENDGDGEEEEDVVRFCCSADVADDDQDQVVYDDGDNDDVDDVVDDNNDVDDNDVDRVFLLDATRVDHSATVPSPVPASSFLFQPIDVATGISAGHGEDNI